RELLPGINDPISAPPVRNAPKDWAQSAPIFYRHMTALKELAARTFTPPVNLQGDGVIICGGAKFWPMVCLSVRMLREVSDLPVQIWHRSDEAVQPDGLSGVKGVTFRNTAHVRPLPRIYTLGMMGAGWVIKTTAIAHCGFRRV